MGSEWINAKLGDVCNINMGQSPKSETYNENGEGLPFYQGRTDFGDRKPRVTKYCSRPIKIAEKGEVLLSVRAPVGDVNIANSQCCIGRGIAALSLIKGDNRFLYYLLKANKTRWDNYSSGTVFPAISKDDIKNFEVYIPSNLCEQQKIASILSAFDDKIELNNEMNKTLEEIAQAIFKHWFIDFEFPNENGEPYKSSGGEFVDSELGPIPKGWKVGFLGEIIDITSGKRPLSRSNEKDMEHRVPLVGASSIMGYVKEVLYNEPIIIIGRVGTLGVVQRYNEPIWASDNTLVIKSSSYEYVYQLLKLLDYSSLNRGSTQPLLTQNDIKNLSIAIPVEDILHKFEELSSSIYRKVQCNKKENDILSQLRDTLLPKLISGEIRVM